jgi:hypothetical protein
MARSKVTQVKEVADRERYVSRALAAWFRSSELMSPPPTDTRVVEFNRLRYVVMASGGKRSVVLAVYRIQNSGQLRRMRRWPKEIQ